MSSSSQQVCVSNENTVGATTVIGLRPTDSGRIALSSVCGHAAGSNSSNDMDLSQLPDIEFPRSVLDSGSNMMVVLSSLHNVSTTAAFGGGLTDSPINIRLLDEVGNERTMRDLVEPINLTLTRSRTDGALCTFWNETFQDWSTDGMEALDDDEDAFRCSTTHLTMFGPVHYTYFIKPLVCTNIDLLSEEGLRAVIKDEWALRPAAIFFWGVLLAHVVLLARASGIDRAHRGDFFADDHNLFIEGIAPEKRNTITARCKGMMSAEGVARNCTLLAIAQRHGITHHDVDSLVGSQGTRPSKGRVTAWAERVEMRTSMSLIASTLLGQSILQTMPDISEMFWSTGFCARSWMFFIAMHPWADISQTSIAMSSYHRALLISARILSSAGLSALYFTVSGDTLSNRSPDACETRGAWHFLMDNLLIGVVSAILSTIPIYVLSLMQRRRFVYSPNWDDEKKSWFMWWWKLTEMMFEAVTVVYSLSWMFFVLVFLANVNAQGGLSWIMSALVGLVRDVFLFPFLAAMALALASLATQSGWPDVVERAKRGLSADEDDRSQLDLAGVNGKRLNYLPYFPPPEQAPPSDKRSALPPLEALDFVPVCPVVPVAETSHVASRPALAEELNPTKRVDAAIQDETVYQYLPKQLEGYTVILQQANGMWLADNSHWRGSRQGVAYRWSKNLDDRVGNDSYVQWGDTVPGEDDGDWVKCVVFQAPELPNALPDTDSDDEVQTRLPPKTETSAPEEHLAPVPALDSSVTATAPALQEAASAPSTRPPRLDVTQHQAREPRRPSYQAATRSSEQRARPSEQRQVAREYLPPRRGPVTSL